MVVMLCCNSIHTLNKMELIRSAPNRIHFIIDVIQLRKEDRDVDMNGVKGV